ncbi:MAG: SDR family oxidoreductase [Pseudomonadota bacterium]
MTRTERRGLRVVVTGASAGVGRATALRLADDGARVALIARDREALEDTARDVAAKGGEALVLPCDVAEAEAVFRAADAAVEAWGGIDVWINDAMVTLFSQVRDLTPDEVRRVTDVCYLGSVHGTLAALRHMQAQDRGVIVQVGSALAYRAIPLQAAYCAAKHAIRGFVDALRVELRHEGSAIRVTSVHLPGVNTPQFAWARSRFARNPRPAGGGIIEPEAAAEAILRAIDRPHRELWVDLQTVVVILGNMLAPSLADRFLARTAVEGQLGEHEVPPDRPGNLEEPVAAHATRGAFSNEAKATAPSFDGVRTVAGTAIAVIALALGLGWTLG